MTDTETTDLRQKILSSITKFAVLTTKDLKAESITEESTFVGLYMDSLDMVELSMELEDDFDVDFRGVELSWVTVKEAVDCVVAIKVKGQHV